MEGRVEALGTTVLLITARKVGVHPVRAHRAAADRAAADRAAADTAAADKVAARRLKGPRVPRTLAGARARTLALWDPGTSAPTPVDGQRRQRETSRAFAPKARGVCQRPPLTASLGIPYNLEVASAQGEPSTFGFCIDPAAAGGLAREARELAKRAKSG